MGNRQVSFHTYILLQAHVFLLQQCAKKSLGRHLAAIQPQTVGLRSALMEISAKLSA